MTPRWSILVLVGVALFSASCRDAPKVARTPTVVWRTLGSWSGRGSMQTGPFISDTGSLRLRWETRNEASPGAGHFRVTVHSDVSGRALVVAVDVRGVGHDTAYVSEDPRSFFLAVEAANLDWTVTAEEGVAATAGPNAGRPAAK
ncbi:MAG: hypothetical protein HY047_07355 [Acidobacteria bacterium]|nr:hypothetical protein [Acidobacteriota bacterium]